MTGINTNNVPVYIVDDEPAIRGAVEQTLLLSDIQCQSFPNAQAALQGINTEHAAIVITDIHMPVMNGLEMMRQLLSQNSDFQIIVLTGYGDVKTAVEAMKSGAYDFIEKPFGNEQLLSAITKAAEKIALLQENQWLKAELDMQTRAGPKLLGHSETMTHLRRGLIRLDAKQSALFVGEAGTGKRLAAQFTHDVQFGAEKELVSLSAVHIADLSLKETQAKLTLLCESDNVGNLYIHHAEQLSHEQCRWLTDTSNALPRVLFSASRPMDTFEHTPTTFALLPLSQRSQDIPSLYKHFVRGAASRYQIQPPNMPREEIEWVRQQPWDGNITQLRQFAELRALKSMPFDETTWQPNADQAEPQALAQKLAYFEYMALFDALQRHGGRLKEVQLELQVSRKTLYDKLKRHQLDKTEFKEQKP